MKSLGLHTEEHKRWTRWDSSFPGASNLAREKSSACRINYRQDVLCVRAVDWHKLRRGDGEGSGTPLQYSCLENPMDGGAWWAAVRGVARSQTQLNAFTFTFYFHALEKEMETHSSVLAWRIPGTGEPDGLLSMGSHRVGHDWRDLAAAAASKRGEEKSLTQKQEGHKSF